ncbi:HlyD family efflux transporter periplasmic adaptor subunit [Planctomycetota bacterium]|nr:HlyD family efflux transporter periplasmic adaptor subunit [Planctomycetota bacterium]
MKTFPLLVVLGMFAMTMTGCINEDARKEPASDGSTAKAKKITNRIDLPANVRQNLGIRFAKVERRMVSKTLRLPGTFELPPESTRVYTTRLAGQVELLVKQYDVVKIGDPLFKLNTLAWPEAREELLALDLEISQAALAATQSTAKAKAFSIPAVIKNQQETRLGFEQQLAGINVHLTDLKSERAVAEARVKQLEDLAAKGAGNVADLAEARADLAATVSAISAEQKGILEVQQAAREFEAGVLDRALEAENLLREAEAADKTLGALKASFDAHLRNTEMKFGLPANTLNTDNWQVIEAGIITAKNAGTVTELHTSGGQWLEQQQTVLTVQQLSKLRFRAHALQGDMGLLKDGLDAQIIPPIGSSLEEAAPINGKTAIAPESDATGRISEVLVNFDGVPVWARNGIRAEVAIVYDDSQKPELCIPVRALVRDGLQLVYFLRGTGKEKDKVIRKEAKALGASDGVWVVLYGGIGPKSEVVVEGAYELKLSNDIPKGGHFHADGTWHAGADH